jgi:hypothetical protein
MKLLPGFNINGAQTWFCYKHISIQVEVEKLRWQFVQWALHIISVETAWRVVKEDVV